MSQDDDLLWAHLKSLPAFRALLRAVEARVYQDLLPLNEPVLDLGCGDGHFAAAAFAQPLAAGIDPAPSALREAQGRRAHQIVIRGLGSALPFADGHFATVVSNSVLEHIPDVDPVLAEVERVLQPEGTFIFCVPSDQFTRLLFFTQALQALRLGNLARIYERYFNRISRHYHCDAPETWEARLGQVGLQIRESFYYFSARAHHALDLGHYFGVPSLLTKKLFGRWILAPRHWNLALTERWLRPLYEEPLPQRGAYLFFIAEKNVVAGFPRPTQSPGPRLVTEAEPCYRFGRGSDAQTHLPGSGFSRMASPSGSSRDMTSIHALR